MKSRAFEPNDSAAGRGGVAGHLDSKGDIGMRPVDDRGEFGRLIAALSAVESGPHADNFLTNEDSFTRVVGDLKPASGAVYLGVGPDQNFTYIAGMRPEWSFIVDHRRRNLRLHLLHKALFTIATDRVGYLAHLTARRPGPLPEDPTAGELVEAFQGAAFDRSRLEATRVEVFRALRPLGVLEGDEWADLASIQERLAGPGMDARFLALPIYPTFGTLIRTPDRDGTPAHLLALEEHYRAVREAQRADRIVPLVGDLAGDDALPRLAEWLNKRGLKVAVVYVSDAEFFLLRDGRFDAYLDNLERLPRADGTLIVRSSTRAIDHPDRVEGDHGTTIARPLATFLDAARAGRVRRPDDLFAIE